MGKSVASPVVVSSGGGNACAGGHGLKRKYSESTGGRSPDGCSRGSEQTLRSWEGATARVGRKNEIPPPKEWQTFKASGGGKRQCDVMCVVDVRAKEMEALSHVHRRWRR